MTSTLALRDAEPVVARRLRTLDLVGGGHLSAASALVGVGAQLYVVADDEHHLGVFDRDSPVAGGLVRLFDGELPAAQRDRKAAKPDLEALLALPPGPGHPHGALWAIGSGSRRARRRSAILAFDAAGALAQTARAIDLAPLHAAIEDALGETPNIEGAFIAGNRLCLLQRGGVRATSACLQWAWAEIARWLDHDGALPLPVDVQRHELGAIEGVPLGFTDGAALPDGGWVYCAAAEATDNAYDDGGCLGSAIGVVDARGRHRWQALLQPRCKVEGIAVSLDDGRHEVLLVSDADDREAPALLLSVRLPASVWPFAA